MQLLIGMWRCAVLCLEWETYSFSVRILGTLDSESFAPGGENLSSDLGGSELMTVGAEVYSYIGLPCVSHSPDTALGILGIGIIPFSCFRAVDI